MTREDEIFDLRMTERDLHLAITNMKIFLQFARNVGKGVNPYGKACLYLRLHQLKELQLLRKMVKGIEIDAAPYMKMKIPYSYKFYDRNLLVLAKITHAQIIHTRKAKEMLGDLNIHQESDMIGRKVESPRAALSKTLKRTQTISDLKATTQSSKAASGGNFFSKMFCFAANRSKSKDRTKEMFSP